VIIPVYNGERFLAEAIQSVLAQTLPPDEIIVVDDGSTDSTAQVVAGLSRTALAPIRYVYQANRGPSAARNQGLRLAQGDVIAFLDADDCWPEHKLAVQMAHLAASPAAGMAWGMVQMCEIADGHMKPIAVPPCYGPNVGSLLLRRSAFEIVGLYDESLRLGEDLEWLARAQERQLPYVRHSDVVLWYRYHGGNVWLGQPNPERSVLLVARKLVERRRQSAAAR